MWGCDVRVVEAEGEGSVRADVGLVGWRVQGVEDGAWGVGDVGLWRVKCAVGFVVHYVESVDARCSCVRGVVFVSCDVRVRVLFDLPKAMLAFDPFPKLFGTLFELVVVRKVCGVGRAFDEVKVTP